MVFDCCSVPIVGTFALPAIYGAWLVLSTIPFAFMLGTRCFPCCDPCGGITELSDPKDEGTWVPSGDWGGFESWSANFALPSSSRWVTWTFVPNPGDESGETWFFYGSQTTSKRGDASLSERQDWNNLCNWYSAKSNSPSVDVSSFSFSFTKRATRLPPDNAVVHIYTPVSTQLLPGGVATVKAAYFWQTGELLAGSTLAPSGQAHVSATEADVFSGYGVVFSGNSKNSGTITGPALFASLPSMLSISQNDGIVDGAARFLWESRNAGTVKGNARFENESDNSGTGLIEGNAAFYGNEDTTNSGVVQGSADFARYPPDLGSGSGLGARNLTTGVIEGGATFLGNTENLGLVENGATFDGAINRGGTVNGGATFINGSVGLGRSLFGVLFPGVVNGGATFDNSFNGSDVFVFGGCTNLQTHIVNGGAVFLGTNTGLSDRPRNERCGIVNDGATFEDSSANLGTVNDGAVFQDNAENNQIVNGGATFNGTADNTGSAAVVNGGATFNDDATNASTATVNGGAVFNDRACSLRTVGAFIATPCTRKFVAHPTDLPTCNGTAPDGCANIADTCGCG